MSALQACSELRGLLRANQPLARHTVWGIGGVARQFYEPADAEDLACFLAGLPADEPVLWLGLGSNVLVRDGGFPGTVVHAVAGLGALEQPAPERVLAQAGVPCPKLARFCARRGLTGAEFFAGIPGTMGGALAMNAGAFGGETWPLVASVESIDRGGRRRTRSPADYRTGYRSVEGPPGEWFLACELCLSPGDGRASQARIRELLERRGDTQPTRARSCGSVFRNPAGDYAARLIEASGLKGTRSGGARVSSLHANFILNEDAATAADVERLMDTIVARVEADHGVRLVPEVQVVGLKSAEAGGE